jgi:hypothetical protein
LSFFFLPAPICGSKAAGFSPNDFMQSHCFLLDDVGFAWLDWGRSAVRGKRELARVGRRWNAFFGKYELQEE